MQTILVATDFSKRAEWGFKRALLLASKHKADICLLHIIDAALPEEIVSHQRNTSKKILQKKIEQLSDTNLPNIDIDIRVGKKSIETIKCAEEKNAGLIILGAHDEYYEDIFSGTLNEKVIRMGNTPVLTIKDDPQKKYQDIVIAVDFSIQSRKAVEFVLDLFPEADIHLIHAYKISLIDCVMEVDTKIKDTIEKKMMEEYGALKSENQKLNVISDVGEASQIIRQNVEKLTPNLLALGTHGKAGLKLALIGSTAENLLNKPPCDILTVKM